MKLNVWTFFPSRAPRVHPGFSAARVTQSLDFWAVLNSSMFVIGPFSLGHYIVYNSAIYGLWLLLWYLLTFIFRIDAHDVVNIIKQYLISWWSGKKHWRHAYGLHPHPLPIPRLSKILTICSHLNIKRLNYFVQLACSLHRIWFRWISNKVVMGNYYLRTRQKQLVLIQTVHE